MTRYLITSALPYINGVKHLGNLIGSMLPGDVYAKFLRQQGNEVLYICGTDEHGTPAEIAAEEAGQNIDDYCKNMYALQKQIYEDFSIDFDYFGRSSAPSNHDLTQEIFLELEKRGFTEEREINQYYSHDDKRFLPDRYVIGTCPHCGFEKARGDQCDGCGTLLDPTDLKDPSSALSGSKNIELQATKHIFLRLDKMTDNLDEWVQNKPEWPDVVKGIAKKWLKEGLQARCITRDLKWGVKVPKPGYENKVFYVWFDAPNGYISITQDWAAQIGDPSAWKRWWPESNTDVIYTQFMAKDNVPFHAIFWPAVLMASDMGWRQVNYIKGFHWLTYDKGKFSTSQKRGVFTDTALEMFPADYWRYYLLANCPESADSDFTFAHFAATVNKDLADILGNFANRSLALVNKYFENKVPVTLTTETLDKALIASATDLVNQYTEALSQMKIRQATQTLRSLWVLGNEYITEQKPWETIKTDRQQAAIALTHCIHLLRLFAITSYPVIPTTAKKILDLINEPNQDEIAATNFFKGLDFTAALPAGHALGEAIRLFNKIEETTVTELTAQFSGEG